MLTLTIDTLKNAIKGGLTTLDDIPLFSVKAWADIACEDERIQAMFSKLVLLAKRQYCTPGNNKTTTTDSPAASSLRSIFGAKTPTTKYAIPKKTEKRARSDSEDEPPASKPRFDVEPTSESTDADVSEILEDWNNSDTFWELHEASGWWQCTSFDKHSNQWTTTVSTTKPPVNCAYMHCLFTVATSC